MVDQKRVEKNLDKFKSLYDTLNRNTLSRDLLAEVYAENIVFEDSLHRVEGLDALFDYFVKMYENVQSIHFEWQDVALNESGGFIRWVMTFRHPRLKKGQGIEVAGVSFLKSRDGKIVEHRDFFDAGEMLYEQVPALGVVIRSLKKRVA
jgi:predicted ester cyclase